MEEFGRLSDEETRELVDLVMKRTKPVLDRVAAPEDRDWAIAQLREVIVPYMLQSPRAKTKEKRKVMAEQTATVMVNTLGRLAPPEVRPYLLKRKYESLVMSIEQRAYELAVRRFTEGTLPGEMESEARQLRQHLVAISNELKVGDAQLRDVYSRPVSEALLDLRYAADGAKPVSIRLYRLMLNSDAGQPPRPEGTREQ